MADPVLAWRVPAAREPGAGAGLLNRGARTMSATRRIKVVGSAELTLHSATKLVCAVGKRVMTARYPPVLPLWSTIGRPRYSPNISPKA